MEKTIFKNSKVFKNFGRVWAAFEKRGLVALSFQEKSVDASIKPWLEDGAVVSQKKTPQHKEVFEQLESYFKGKALKFQIPFCLDYLTPFQVKVLKKCQRIPWGQVLSYGELAQKVGRPKAARAVGGVMHRNPLPLLIPCHRVVTSNRRLGGFAFGLSMKKRLLSLEGVKI